MTVTKEVYMNAFIVELKFLSGVYRRMFKHSISLTIYKYFSYGFLFWHADLLNVFEVFLPQLLLYPNPSDPLNGDAASLMMKDKKQYDQKVKGEWCSLNVQICPQDLKLPCFQLKFSHFGVVVGKWIHLSQAAGLKFTMLIRLNVQNLIMAGKCNFYQSNDIFLWLCTENIAEPLCRYYK